MLNKIASLRLMQGRLDVYNKETSVSNLDGVQHQETRLEQHGGNL